MVQSDLRETDREGKKKVYGPLLLKMKEPSLWVSFGLKESVTTAVLFLFKLNTER